MADALPGEDLKTEPFWWDAAPRPVLPEDDLPTHLDVAVVGSGYAGLSAALVLAHAGRSVAVFESGEVGVGASTRNGGICSGSLKVPFRALERKFGLETAAAIYGEGKEARAALATFIADEGIACAFHPVGRFLGAHRRRDYEALAREAERLRKHVGIESEMVPRAEQHREIGTDLYHGGELRPDVAGLHPALFHQGLLERAQQAGVTVVARTPVTGILRETHGTLVATSRGRVATRDVIVATNGYTEATTPWLQRRLVSFRSQIIATEPLAPEVMDRLVPQRRMLGDTRRLHNYFRPSPDGTRILFGGRAGMTKADPRESGTHLYRNMTAVFPELKGVAISHAWSGYVAYTFDFLPHVAVHDGVHYVAGFCGSGVVWATHLGRKTAHKVLGSAEGKTVFDGRPFRSRPFYRGKPWFLPGAVAVLGLRDRLPV